MSDDFFENLLAGGVGVGTGVYAFRKRMNDPVVSVGPVFNQPKNPLIGKLNSIASDGALEHAIRDARKTAGLHFLDPLTDKTLRYRDKSGNAAEKIVRGRLSRANIESDLIKSEWRRAVESVVPEPKRFTAGFHLGDDPIAGVRRNLLKNPSIYSHDVFERFRFNMESLMQSGGPTDLVSSSGFRNLGLMQSTIQGNLPRQLQPLVEAMGGRGPFQFNRIGPEGQGLYSVSRRRGQALESLFTIPESFAAPGSPHRGLARTGDNLQNIYAPGLFQMTDELGNPIGDMLTFGQYKIQRLTQVAEQVRSGELTGTMEQVLKATSSEIDKLMPFVQPSIGDTPLTPEAVYRSKQFTAIGPDGTPLKGLAKTSFVEKQSSKMGFIPAGGDARFSLGTADEIFGGISSELDYSRKPWQTIREFRPTMEAMDAIKSSTYGGAQFDFLGSPLVGSTLGDNASAARLKTLYLDDAQIETLRGLGFPVGDGELLVNKNMGSQLEVAKLARVRLNEVNAGLAADIMTQLGTSSERGVLKEAINLNKKDLIGRTLEGTFASARANSRIIGAAPVSIKTMSGQTGTALDLVMEEIIPASGSSKVFGLKGQARQLDFENLFTKEVISKLELEGIENLSGFGAIARAADVSATKDPSKYLMQQFSGVMEYARQMTETDAAYAAIRSGTATGIGYDAGAEKALGIGRAQEILNRAPQYLDEINQLEGVAAKSAAIREIASDIGLSEAQMSAVFNESGTRMGIASLSPGSPKWATGAGKVGTFEPRIFTLLEGGAFGDMKDNLTDDFMTRLYHGRPEVAAMYNQLGLTAKSLAGEFTPGGGTEVFSIGDLQDPARGNQLRATGGFLSTGVDELPHIYMPGWEQAPSMRPRLVGGKHKIQGSPVAQIFRDIERDIELVSGNALSTEEFLSKFDDGPTGYTSQLWQALAPGGKGQGAVARGDLLGSRYLTAISDIGEIPSPFIEEVARDIYKGVPEGHIVGIPANMAEEMFKEMEGMYGMGEMASTRKRFEEGKAIGGMVARHPLIGPYSSLPVLMVKSQTDEPTMLVPERMKKVKVSGAGFSVEKEISTGILKGLALDKDADIPMSITLNRQMEERVREGLMNSGSKLQRDLAAYEAHAIRSSLLKMSAKSGREMTKAQQAAAAVGKLGITDEEVGRVSTKLTQARTALVNSTMSKGDITRGLSLLEWMEQQPISGKHLNPSQVLEGIFEEQMFRIRKGAEGQSTMLKDVVREMLDYSGDTTQNKINQALLGEGLSVDGKFVKGFQLDKTASQIDMAVRGFMSRSKGVQQKQIQDFISPPASKQIKRSQLGQALKAISGQTSKGIRGIQQTALSNLNKKLSQAGAKVRPFAKPAMIGLAAAGAASFMLSGSPSDVLPPPRFGKMDTSPPVSTTNQSRDEIGPLQSPQLGEPSASPLLSNSARMLDESAAEKGKAIRARINANHISPQQRAALSRRLAANYQGSVNMNVRDSRRSLNSTTVTDILDQ